MKFWTFFLDLIYPKVCVNCGKELNDTYWCQSCLKKFWNPRMIQMSQTKDLSGCYTLCNYVEGIRKVIIQLKYNGRSDRRYVFPELLSDFPWWNRLESCSIAIPIPLAKKRFHQRGYNQTDLIFQEWLEKMGKKYISDGLVRTRNTETQSLLSKDERYENMRGVFHVNHGIKIEGKSILLIDDVYTTGATMNVAAHELKRNGATTVVGLSLASGAS